MKSLLAGALGMGLTLTLLGGTAWAQDAPIIINADGANSGAANGSTSNNNGGDIYLGDITDGPGGTVIEISNAPGPQRPQPSPPPASGSQGNNPAPSDDGELAAPTAEDRDADNYPDALEADAGLDPTNPDTDEDGVADGDERNVFGTDPLLYDTDGDGYGDGEELFWTESDPLDPENRSGITNVSAQQIDNRQEESTSTGNQERNRPTPPPPATSNSAPNTAPTIGGIAPSDANTTAVGGAATVLGRGDASAAPGDVARGVDDPAAVIRGTTATDNTDQCSAYGDWYEAQTNYEDAGGVDAADSLVSAVDPDRDGIACEDLMESAD